jgi:hypothetical protein
MWIGLGVMWVVCILVATHIGVKRGFPVLAFINGLCLGPLGLLFVIIQDDQNRISCPHCAEKILKQAKICPMCQQPTSKS